LLENTQVILLVNVDLVKGAQIIEHGVLALKVFLH
jgi:hypothetical protein